MVEHTSGCVCKGVSREVWHMRSLSWGIPIMNTSNNTQQAGGPGGIKKAKKGEAPMCACTTLLEQVAFIAAIDCGYQTPDSLAFKQTCTSNSLGGFQAVSLRVGLHHWFFFVQILSRLLG